MRSPKRFARWAMKSHSRKNEADDPHNQVARWPLEAWEPPSGRKREQMPNALRYMLSGMAYALGLTSSAQATELAELCKPAPVAFTLNGNITDSRAFQIARLITTGPHAGHVLIACGSDHAGNTLSVTELYNPATGQIPPQLKSDGPLICLPMMVTEGIARC